MGPTPRTGGFVPSVAEADGSRHAMTKAVAELDGFELYAWVTATCLPGRDDCPEHDSESVSPGVQIQVRQLSKSPVKWGFSITVLVLDLHKPLSTLSAL